jgi:hypothetical protein
MERSKAGLVRRMDVCALFDESKSFLPRSAIKRFVEMVHFTLIKMKGCGKIDIQYYISVCGRC